MARARMNDPMKRNMIGSAKGANAWAAGATPSTTASDTPSRAVMVIGTASLIHSTTTAPRIGGEPMRRQWQRQRCGPEGDEHQRGEHQADAASPQLYGMLDPVRPAHRTSHVAFGVSPNRSGAYSASTRVGGSSNVPGWFRRMV